MFAMGVRVVSTLFSVLGAVVRTQNVNSLDGDAIAGYEIPKSRGGRACALLLPGHSRRRRRRSVLAYTRKEHPVTDNLTTALEALRAERNHVATLVSTLKRQTKEEQTRLAGISTAVANLERVSGAPERTPGSSRRKRVQVEELPAELATLSQPARIEHLMRVDPDKRWTLEQIARKARIPLVDTARTVLNRLADAGKVIRQADSTWTLAPTADPTEPPRAAPGATESNVR